MKKMNILDEPRKPFTVPENYFEDFAAKWETSHSASKPARKNYTLRKWLYAAAVIVGIVVIGQIIYLLHEQNTIHTNEDYELYLYSQLDKETIYDYYLTQEE